VICPSWLPMRRSSFGVWNSRNIDAELIVSRRKWSSVLCGRPSARHTLVTGYNLEVDEIFWELDEIFLRVLASKPIEAVACTAARIWRKSLQEWLTGETRDRGGYSRVRDCPTLEGVSTASGMKAHFDCCHRCQPKHKSARKQSGQPRCDSDSHSSRVGDSSPLVKRFECFSHN